MKRGSWLLIFALSIFFVGIFSFLPMVSGKDCGIYKNYEDCTNNVISNECFGSEITYHYCYWDPPSEKNSQMGACLDSDIIGSGEDCANLKDEEFCSVAKVFSNVFGFNYVIMKYTGSCAIVNTIGGCASKLVRECDIGFKCEIVDKKGRCVVDNMFAEETITSDGKTGLASLKLLESKSLIFKTALAVLLVVLILAIIIYFKPKKRK